MKKSLLVLSFFVWVVVSLFPEENNVKFEQISVEQGLSQSSVFCILQDREGFMWFGTENGLNRYDGYDFTVYNYNPKDTTSISENRIKCIFEDHLGNLWVGTYSTGLNLFPDFCSILSTSVNCRP